MPPAARDFRLPPYRGLIVPEFDTSETRGLLARIDSLADDPTAEVLQAGRNLVVAARTTAADGRVIDLVIKAFRPRGFSALKTIVVPSKAVWAWRGALHLGAAGLLTPLPVACLEARSRGIVRRSFFLAERLKEGTEIRGLLRDLPPDRLRPLLAELAHAVRLGHDRGVLHADLSDGNVLVQGLPGGPFRFYFLDTNRIKKRRRLGPLARARNLVRLGIPPALRRGFLEAYAGGAGPRPAFAFLYARSKSAFSGWLRFKKKAKLRAWARKLKIQ